MTDSSCFRERSRLWLQGGSNGKVLGGFMEGKIWDDRLWKRGGGYGRRKGLSWGVKGVLRAECG